MSKNKSNNTISIEHSHGHLISKLKIDCKKNRLTIFHGKKKVFGKSIMLPNNMSISSETKVSRIHTLMNSLVMQLDILCHEYDVSNFELHYESVEVIRSTVGAAFAIEDNDEFEEFTEISELLSNGLVIVNNVLKQKGE